MEQVVGAMSEETVSSQCLRVLFHAFKGIQFFVASGRFVVGA